MKLLDKIEYIIKTDGCEYSDGFQYLQTFCSYCDVEIDKVLDVIEDDIDRIYKSVLRTQQELEKELIKYKYVKNGGRFKASDGFYYFKTVDGCYNFIGRKAEKDFDPDELVNEIQGTY